MTDFALHLAPNAPWAGLALASLALIALAVWAYRFTIPPLPALARRALRLLRGFVLLAVVWLLSQPVLERLGGEAAHVVVLRDRSRSMRLAVAPGGEPRAVAADRAVESLEKAWRGRARVDVLDFASRLGADSIGSGSAAGTALGDALDALGRSPLGARASAVVVVSDGITNRGEDPIAVGRSLGLPVHTVIVGRDAGVDRAVSEVETPASARVGEITPVRVHVSSNEPRGTLIPVSLSDGDRVLARTRVPAPGPGAEAVAELRATPARPGLAIWTARVDSLPGEETGINDARQCAIDVAPGRLGVLVLSGGLNWDLTFMRRAWSADSSLALTTLVRERLGWRTVETGRMRGAPDPADLRSHAVVVLDGLGPADLGPPFEKALANFVGAGGGLLVLGGAPPGLTRFQSGPLGGLLGTRLDGSLVGRGSSPVPAPDGRELLAWDEDPARGDAAWRSAAPLADVAPIAPGAGDRVLIGSGGGPPLLFSRRIGRGPVLMLNGSGEWRWSLSPEDDRSGERGRTLWRNLVRWLAEPVQGEPLRVRPERWLAAGGEPVRLLAALQDASFRPVAGATLSGEARGEDGSSRAVSFRPRDAGSYEATLEDLPPGRYRVTVRAERDGRELGRSGTELAVDRWSLEEARTAPDSSGLAQLAEATGGRSTEAGDIGRWAREMPTRALALGHGRSQRLWESPWVFATILAALSLEWGWRRRRGLP